MMSSSIDSTILQLLKNISSIDQVILGVDYLAVVTSQIGEALGVEYLLLGRSLEGNPFRIKTDISWSKSKGILPNIEYDLAGTPCQEVITGNRVCVHPKDVAKIFPEDALLTEMKIEGYIAAPIINKNRNLTGLILALDTKIIDEATREKAISILEFFSSRIALEYFRIEAEAKLKALNAKLEQEIQERTIKLIEAEREMRNQERLANLGLITMGIAHELKNPFNIISGSSDIIGDTIDKALNGINPRLSQQEFVDTLVKMRKANDVLKKQMILANHSLDSLLRQARAGELRPHNVTIVLSDCLDNCLQTVLSRFEKTKFTDIIKISKDYEEIILKLSHREIFENAIEVFFDNAIYALLEKNQIHPGFEGKLFIETRKMGSKYKIVIRDNGVGIPDEIKNKLGRPFVSTKPKGQGTGLGIYLANIFIEKNEGEMNINSASGEFTEVQVVLKAI